jgi:D-alanyl-D-alanine carboxypeptidase
MKIKTCLLGALILTSLHPLAQAELSAVALQNALNRSLASLEASGASAAIVRNGTVVWQGQAGVIAPGSTTPVNADTLFVHASASKMVTAAMTLRLVEQGLVDLDTTIDHYLPAGVPGAAQVTVRQLLRQTSGYPDLFPDPEDPDKNPSNDLVVRMLSNASLTRADLISYVEAPISTQGKHKYSNTDYVLLGEVIERASGKTFAQVYQQEIVFPLGLTRSFVTPRPREEFAQSTDYEFGEPPINFFDINTGLPNSLYGEAFGDGPVAGTATDGALFLDGLMHGRVLQSEMLGQMLDFDPESGYGMGLMDQSNEGLPITFAGSWAGYMSRVAYFPDTDLTYMTLANSNANFDAEWLMHDVLAAANAGAVPEPATTSLAGAAVLGAAILWRRRKRQAAA